MTDETANPPPPVRLLAWADYVEAVVGNPTLARRGRRTPPLKAYRSNAKGRAVWLARAARDLRREGYDTHLTLDRDLPAPRVNHPAPVPLSERRATAPLEQISLPAAKSRENSHETSPK